ncbi:MAG TPA: DUF4175 domain-containing protein, partial [Paracoccus sp.]|nr:DUF4175 domain-containing protein [Paracoccus sp. (in: a-proteobacteria)]
MPRPAETPPRSLRRAMALTRAGMVLERVALAFWPALSLILLAGAAVAFGLPAHLPYAWFQGGAAL